MKNKKITILLIVFALIFQSSVFSKKHHTIVRDNMVEFNKKKSALSQYSRIGLDIMDITNTIFPILAKEKVAIKKDKENIRLDFSHE